MQALILAAVLNYTASPVCQQWQDRVDQESRIAARMVWSPQKERHMQRMNYAMEQAHVHCAEEEVMQEIVAESPAPTQQAPAVAGF